jgi:hypothetical protein
MLKRLAFAALAMSISGVALAQEPPKSTEDCLKLSFDFAKSAEDKKLDDAKLAKVEELLGKLEGHCDAQQFAEAATVAKDVQAIIDGK